MTITLGIDKLCLANYTEVVGTCYIIAYSICKKGKHPFIKVLLTRPLPTDELAFPVVDSDTIENAYRGSKNFIDSVFCGSYDKIFHTHTVIHNKSTYLWLDISEIDENYICPSSNHAMALLDEILNHRKVCDTPVAFETTKYIISYFSLFQLYQKGATEPLWYPSVKFVGRKSLSQLKYTFFCGSEKRSGICGNAFYFTDYEEAINPSAWINNVSDKFSKETDIYGVVRFAIFFGEKDGVEDAASNESAICVDPHSDVHMLAIYEWDCQYPLSQHKL